MRLRTLDLVRYGGFADRRLDLGDGAVDLHLIVGPNEAGKSTMLEAIGDLLFGIPGQSHQNWRFDYGDLRIRALIEQDGDSLDVTRRKGNRNTLLAPDGTALPDDILAPLLGGLDRRGFERMFGLDHAQLRRGGEEILLGKDDSARVVLEASTGLSNIGKELHRLETAASELFKPGGQIPPVNRLMRERGEAQALVREHSVSDADWSTIRTSKTEGERDRAALIEEAHDLAERASAIERINRVRPLLARKAAANNRLSTLGDVVDMPPDAGARLGAALAERSAATALKAAEDDRIARRAEQRATLTVDAALIAHAADIRGLGDRIILTEKLEGDLRDMRAQRASLDAHISAVRRDGGLAGDQSVPPSGPRKRLRDSLEAMRTWAADDARHRDAMGAADKETARLAALPADSDGDGGLTALGTALAALPADSEERERERTSAVERAKARRDKSFEQLAPWTGSADALTATVPPAPSEVERFATAIARATTTLAEARDDLAEADADQARLTREIADLEAGAVLPTPEAIAEARGARDAVIDDIEAHLSAPTARDGTSLGLALRHTIERADQLADLRDGDAGRLERRRHAIEQRDIAIAAAETARGSIDRTLAEHQDLEQRWTMLLASIGFARPLPPDDMARWRSARDMALTAAEDHATEVALQQREQALLVAQRDALIKAIPEIDRDAATGWPTARLVEEARSALARLDAAARNAEIVRNDRAALAADQAALVEEAGRLGERHTALNLARAELMDAAGLAAGIDDGAIGDALDAFDLLVTDLSTRDGLDRRIMSDQRDLDGFQADLGTLFEALGRPTPDRPFVTLRALLDELDAALLANQKIEQLANADSEAADAMADLDLRINAAERDIEQLLAQAQLTDETALAHVIEVGLEAADLRDELAQLDRELGEQGDGFTASILAEEAGALGPDAAAAELADIRARQREIEEERETIGRRLADAEAAISRVATEARAAEAQQEVASTSAALAEAAEAHIRAASAAALLRWVIDRHRATNQAPLIARAGELFAKMTGGSFDGLVLDFGEDDRPRIMGARTGGNRVAVEGMSEGTRDQLFLALRLGAIDLRNSVQPIPIVCDDLLITADNDRAAEIITCLGIAARQTQVLLFSHHEHIIDVFADTVGADGYRMHRLDRADARAA